MDFINNNNRQFARQAHILRQFSGISELGAEPSSGKAQTKEMHGVLMKSASYNIIGGINKVFDGEEDTLEKGEISSILSDNYGNKEPVKFKKTGKELKELLPKTIAKLEAAKAVMVVQMAALVEKIGFDPTEKHKSYSFRSIVMDRYPYNVCYQPYDNVKGCTPESTEENKNCSQYNDLVYNLISIEEDIFATNIFIENVEPKTTYTFTINQLAAISV